MKQENVHRFMYKPGIDWAKGKDRTTINVYSGNSGYDWSPKSWECFRCGTPNALFVNKYTCSQHRFNWSDSESHTWIGCNKCGKYYREDENHLYSSY